VVGGGGEGRKEVEGVRKRSYVGCIETISSVLFSLIVPIKLGSWVVRQGDRRTLTR